MRIFVDARAVFRKQGGVGRAIVSTVEAACRRGGIEFRVLSNFPAKWDGFSGLKRISYAPPTGNSIEKRTIWEQTHLRRLICREEPDVLWSPWNWGIPLRLGIPSLLTVHDVIPLRRRNPMGSRYRSVIYRVAVKQSILSAALIVTPSEKSREEVVSRCRVSPEKISAVHWGVDSIFRPSEMYGNDGRSGQTILYVGGNEERKNLEVLFDAYNLLLKRASHDILSLSLTGSPDRLSTPAAAAYSRLGTAARVTFLGPLSDAELADVYRAADVFVFPSLEEGFGFPPLEAQASGLPVVCGNADSIPEIVGEAALRVNVSDPKAVADAVSHLLTATDLRTRMRQDGLKRAQKFSWDACAASYIDLFQRLTNGLESSKQ